MDTLRTGLSHYRIGPKVHALRKRKKLSLVQLGAHTGLSSAMLSKIERGQLFPTLPTLLRIAMVFDLGLDHFFVDAEKRRILAVVRKADRIRLPNQPGKGHPAYFFESLDFPVNNRKIHAFHAVFPHESRPSPSHAHEGEELIYVISGAIVVTVDGRDIALAEGDAMYFDSNLPHNYRGDAKTPSAAMVVVAQ
ncbi:MAG: helix-turn-helix domain-containing protein [Alphaproteobacteria bacterium]